MCHNIAARLQRFKAARPQTNFPKSAARGQSGTSPGQQDEVKVVPLPPIALLKWFPDSFITARFQASCLTQWYRLLRRPLHIYKCALVPLSNFTWRQRQASVAHLHKFLQLQFAKIHCAQLCSLSCERQFFGTSYSVAGRHASPLTSLFLQVVSCVHFVARVIYTVSFTYLCLRSYHTSTIVAEYILFLPFCKIFPQRYAQNYQQRQSA